MSADLQVQVQKVGGAVGDTMDDLDYPGLVFSDILYPVDVNSFKNCSPLLELETVWTKKKLFFSDDTHLLNAPGRGHGKHLFTNRLLLAALQEEKYNRLGKGQGGQGQIPVLVNYDECQFEPYTETNDEIGIEDVEIESSAKMMDTEVTPLEIISASKLPEPEQELEPEPKPGCSYERCESVKDEAITEEMATSTFQMDNEAAEVQQYVNESGYEVDGDDEEEGNTSSTWCEAAKSCFKDVGDWCSSRSAKDTNSNSMTYGDDSDSDSDQIDEREKASPKKSRVTSTSLKMKTNKKGQLLLLKKFNSSKTTKGPSGVITAQDELRILVDEYKEIGGPKRGQKTSNN